MTNATSYRISLPDETLVGASVRGDTAAFGVLVSKHKDAVYGIAMTRLNDPDRAKDVTQDVFLEAYQSLTNLQDPAKFSRWVIRMTISLSELARREMERMQPLDVLEQEATVTLVGQREDPIEQEEVQRRVREALERLGTKTQEAVMLVYINGYSHEEVADYLDVPVNTVKSRVHNGQKQLRRELADFAEQTIPRMMAPTSALTDAVMANLTASGEINEIPSWSPDGTMLAFPSDRGGHLNIWVMPSDGGDAAARQLTFHVAEDQRPTWSPDGTSIAFLSDRSGAWEIWVIPVTGGQPWQLTIGATIVWHRTFPRWSPDGRWIAFASSDKDGHEELLVIPSKGGAPRSIVSYDRRDGGVGHPIWSPDGAHLAFHRSGEIWTVPVAGGAPRRVIRSERRYFWPMGWSPDGRHLLCAASWLNHTDIWMAPVSGAKPVHLLSRGNDAWPGGWSPDGERIAFMAKERRLGTIMTVPSAGGPVEEIAIPTNMEAKEPVWWTNGQGIYFSGREREDAWWHIWSLAFSDQQLQQLTDGPAHDHCPRPSPDGQSVAFLSTQQRVRSKRMESLDLWVAPVAGGSPKRLTSGHYVWGLFLHGQVEAWSGQHRRKSFDHNVLGKVFSGDAGSWGGYGWSADSKRIVFSSWRGGQHVDIWMVQMNGSAPKKLTDSTGVDYCPVWCPDDATIAFLSDRGVGARHVWTVAGAGQDLRQTDLPVTDPFAWSPDGRQMAYNTKLKIVILDLSGTPPVPRTIFWGPVTPSRPCWSPDESRLLFQRQPTKQTIHVMEVGGTPFDGKGG